MKLHPLSAVWHVYRRVWFGVMVPAFLTIFGSAQFDIDFMRLAILIPIGFVLGASYGVVYYHMFRYELTEDSFDVHSGVISRRNREIPFSRIQNIDVSQPLIKRLLGMAVVTVETAGGGQSEAKLDFVSMEEATRLQQLIRERKRTEGETEPTAGESIPEGADESSSPALDQTSLFELRETGLAVYSLVVLRPRAAFFLVLGFPFFNLIPVNELLGFVEPLGAPSTLAISELTPDAVLTLMLVSLPILIVLSWVMSLIYTVSTFYDFTLGRSGTDLVYERGLLNRYSGSIPLGKIQTITLTEPVLARLLGWAGLTVETAGYAVGQSDMQGSNPAVPIAPKSRTLELLREIEDVDELSFTRPPKRSRRRYGARYLGAVLLIVLACFLIDVTYGGFSRWYAPAALLGLAPLGAHLKWKHRGYHVGENHIVIRDGFWWRETRIVPYDRLQTVQLHRTLFQRRLDLAHLTADTASSIRIFSSDATAFDIDLSEARELRGVWCERFQGALAH